MPKCTDGFGVGIQLWQSMLLCTFVPLCWKFVTTNNWRTGFRYVIRLGSVNTYSSIVQKKT